MLVPESLWGKPALVAFNAALTSWSSVSTLRLFPRAAPSWSPGINFVVFLFFFNLALRAWNKCLELVARLVTKNRCLAEKAGKDNWCSLNCLSDNVLVWVCNYRWSLYELLVRVKRGVMTSSMPNHICSLTHVTLMLLICLTMTLKLLLLSMHWAGLVRIVSSTFSVRTWIHGACLPLFRDVLLGYFTSPVPLFCYFVSSASEQLD